MKAGTFVERVHASRICLAIWFAVLLEGADQGRVVVGRGRGEGGCNQHHPSAVGVSCLRAR